MASRGKIRAAMDVLMGRAPLPAIPERRPAMTMKPPRFRVLRIVNDRVWEGYAGESGTDARKVYERYMQSDPADYPGELRFEDSQHGNRGCVLRALS